MTLDEAVTEANLLNEGERAKGSAVRYFTVADPPCICPDNHKVVSRILKFGTAASDATASRIARLFH